MRKIIQWFTTFFITIAVVSFMIYGAFSYFELKVKEEYNLLMETSQKVLEVYLDDKAGDLYMLCMLDYHMNPNGSEMLKECSNMVVSQQEISTPYYDFYINYMKDL